MRASLFQQKKLLLICKEGGVDWIYSPAGLWQVDARLCQMDTVETGRLQCDVENRWDRVAAFIKHHGWDNAQVIILLEPRYIRYFFVEGESVESVEEFDQWMAELVAMQLPLGMSITEFEYRSQVLFQDEYITQCVIGLVRRDYVDKERRGLHEAGLYPTVLSGMITQVHGVNERGADLVNALLADQKRFLGNVDDYEFNFLNEADRRANVRRREKGMAKRVVLLCGLLLATLVVVLLVLQKKADNQIAASEERLGEFEHQASVLEQQKQMIQGLQTKLDEGRRYIKEGTFISQMLTLIGSNMPAGVWLDMLSISEADAGERAVLLQCVAIEDQSITELLSRLETLEQVKEVKLLMLKSLPAEQLYKKERIHDLILTRVDIQLDMVPDGLATKLQPVSQQSGGGDS